MCAVFAIRSSRVRWTCTMTRGPEGDNAARAAPRQPCPSPDWAETGCRREPEGCSDQHARLGLKSRATRTKSSGLQKGFTLRFPLRPLRPCGLGSDPVTMDTDDNGWARGAIAPLPVAEAWTLLSPDPSSRVDAARWAHQAATFFRARLRVVQDKRYPAGTLPLADRVEVEIAGRDDALHDPRARGHGAGGSRAGGSRGGRRRARGRSEARASTRCSCARAASGRCARASPGATRARRSPSRRCSRRCSSRRSCLREAGRSSA